MKINVNAGLMKREDYEFEYKDIKCQYQFNIGFYIDSIHNPFPFDLDDKENFKTKKKLISHINRSLKSLLDKLNNLIGKKEDEEL